VLFKELLRRHDLKSAYTGGLSSYALTLMIAQFVQIEPALRSEWMRVPLEQLEQPGLASLLLECLHFYGHVWDAQRHCIAGHTWGCVDRSHASLSVFALHPLLVCDPANPNNNVGRGCYRIRQIQSLFREAAKAIADAAEGAAAEGTAAEGAVTTEELATSSHESVDGPAAASGEGACEAAAAALSDAAVIRALFCGK